MTFSSCTTIQPRVCGDYSKGDYPMEFLSDTTPRMRGLQAKRQQEDQSRRYNPAYAGTTFSDGSVHAIQPRVCGDYFYLTGGATNDSDTTPRMRGLQVSHFRGTFLARYNPAYAGTTHARSPQPAP